MTAILKPHSSPLWLLALLAGTAFSLASAGCDSHQNAGDDDTSHSGDDDTSPAADDDATADDDTAADDDTTPPADDDTSKEECDDVVVLSGTLATDMTLSAACQYLLRGGVFVGDEEHSVTLTIEPGTTVYGETSSVGMLVIHRGSKLMAEGTADSPIVFTSSKAPGSRSRGDWGGLIINGRATTNAGEEAYGEGGTGWYGGTDDADNSGVLRYIRVEFAGQLLSPDNELNGIAFQGVGSGTEVDYLQIHMAKDDGIEFFGGTVSARHIFLTGGDDDNLDWTDGWRGKIQFVVAQQYDDGGDNGIEADNNAEDNEALPRSHPQVSNVTLIGSPDSDLSDIGVLLREGTHGNLSNLIVAGWNDVGLSIDQESTYLNAWTGSTLSGDLTLQASIFSNGSNFESGYDFSPPFTVEEFFTDLNTGNQVVGAATEVLADPFNLDQPGLTPKGAALTGAVVPADPFFEAVSYRGGVDPENDWTLGWTTSVRN